MGSSSSNFVSESITNILVKQTTKNFTENVRSQRSSQSLKINNVGGNVDIGTVDLSNTQTLSLSSIHTYQLSTQSAAEIAKQSTTELQKQQNSPLAQVSHSSLYNTIRTNISVNLDIENVKKDISDQLERQVVDIEDVKGNVKVGSLTMEEQSTIVAKVFENAIESSKISSKILEALKVEDVQISTGPIGTISQELGISYRSTVFAIAIVVAVCVLGFIIMLLSLGGGSSEPTYRVRPPLS